MTTLIGSSVKINEFFMGNESWIGREGYIVRTKSNKTVDIRVQDSTGRHVDLTVGLNEIHIKETD